MSCIASLLRAGKVLALVGAGTFLLSCAKDSPEAQIEAAIDRLQSGETISRIEKELESVPALPRANAPEAPEVAIEPTAPVASAPGFHSRAQALLQSLQSSQKRLIEFRKKDADGNPRSAFNDSDLDSLLALTERAQSEARLASSRILELIREHDSLIHSGEDQDLDWVKALAQTLDADQRSKALELLTTRFDPIDLEPFYQGSIPLFPFGLPPLVTKAANSRKANPFAAARTSWVLYSDDASELRPRIELYRKHRDSDNPPWEQALPFEKVVPVAFLDSGIDFPRFKELSLFLGPSNDFADSDSNPWLPMLGPVFSHGTGTSATLLSMVARLEEDLLRERRIEIRMWKTHTVRQLLSRYAAEQGPQRDDPSWESRPSIQEAILSSVDSTSPPRILLAPMGFNLRERLLASGNTGALKRAPWLWVMAAGNSGEDARLSQPSPCLLDLPDGFRPAESILCVGAAKMGEYGPEIAEYSNRGPAVDFHVLDDFEKLCPSGTSCSAPAAGAAAAMLAAKYPELSSRAIRTILRRSSEWVFTPKVRFRYFDPTKMMDRAYQLAEQHVKKE